MVTSRSGILGLIFSISISISIFEQNHAGQVRRAVRVESLVECRIASNQLACKGERSHAQRFRQIATESHNTFSAAIGSCRRLSTESPSFATAAARYCKAISMDVNERVITVLCSSASGKRIERVVIASSFCFGAHETDTVGIFLSFSNCAARSTSEV